MENDIDKKIIDQGLVSIIIPIYNVEAYVKKSLESALNQTYENIELILVDDRGKDRSMDVVKEIVGNSKRKNCVRIITQEKNSGAAEARNAGLREAKGEYVYFMDADDIVSPDCISKLLGALKQSKADLAIANVRLVGLKSVHVKTFNATLESDKALKYFLDGILLPSPCNKLITREMFTRTDLSFMPGLLQEDILWAYKLFLETKTFTPITETTYDYIVRKDSSSRALNSKKRIESLLFIIKEINNDYQKGKIPSSVTVEYHRFINSWCFTTALLLLYYAGENKEAKLYYNEIQKIAFMYRCSAKGQLLRMSFFCFKLFIKPLYSMYKLLQ